MNFDNLLTYYSTLVLKKDIKEHFGAIKNDSILSYTIEKLRL